MRRNLNMVIASLFFLSCKDVYPDLRKQSAEYIASKDADGNAIGGLAVGEPVDKMYEMIELVNEILPRTNHVI